MVPVHGSPVALGMERPRRHHPKKPQVVNFIEGPSNTWAIQLEVNAGKMITALERMPASWGGDPNAAFDEGVLVWDLAEDPVRPRLPGQFRTGGTGTHRDFYAGGRYLHLAAGMPGFSGNIYVIIDIADPSRPAEVGRWWVPGQHVAGGETPEPAVSLHGPPGHPQRARRTDHQHVPKTDTGWLRRRGSPPAGRARAPPHTPRHRGRRPPALPNRSVAGGHLGRKACHETRGTEP